MTKKLLLIAFILISVKLLAQSPVLSNFRVEDSQKARVYFDSSDPITGSNTNGFVISGKNITGVTINSDQTTGHYFMVSSAFTFWDNNTIRYNGNSDINAMGFDLQYISNNIAEPSASNDRYVSISGNNSNNGLTEATAWRTISYAGARATAGQTVHVKAGNYGNENVIIENNGTSTNPIKFIGYQDTPGDNPNLNWNYNNTRTWSSGNPLAANTTGFDEEIMPLLSGSNELSNRGFDIQGDFIIVKNIQVQHYDRLIGVNGRRDAVRIDNCYTSNGTYGFLVDQSANTRITITNSLAFRTRTCGIRFYGSFNRVENHRVWDDRFDGSDGYSNDYYIQYKGSNNIIRGNHIERVGDTTHDGHGYSCKDNATGDGYLTEYNLLENSTSRGINLSLEYWHTEVKYNVARNIFVDRDNATLKSDTGGFDILSGASNNIFDRVHVNNTDRGVYFTRGNNNTFKNCVFTNNTNAIRVDSQVSGNTFINCTFDNNRNLTSGGGASGSSFEVINSNFTNITRGNGVNGFSFTYSNFYNSWGTPSGAGNVSVDPLYVNATGLDYRLQDVSPIKDSGTTVDNVLYDKDAVVRINGKYSIGAYDDAVNSIGSVSPNVSICNGESVTLIASGGTSYLWNTGETTSELDVSPSITTVYTVTITDGNGSSESYDVEVTVNEMPSVDLGADQTICYGESITLTATGTGDFLWSTGETTASITVQPTATITYSVTASNSCATDATDDIIVNVNPEIGLTIGSDITICVGEGATLTATGNGDFLWSTGETTSSITVQPDSTTTYTVASTLGDCTENESILVTVNEAPSVDLGVDQTICYGESITLTATGAGDFLWSTGETTASITVQPTATMTYSVTASNLCATDATDDIIVNVNPDIELTVGSDIIICVGESTTLTATGTGDFLWSTGETTSSITVQPDSTTTYTVASTLGDCTENESVLVTVNEMPSVDLGTDQTICYGESVTLTATGTGDFLWSTGETTASITVQPTATITYSVTASNLCATDATDDIIVNVNPDIGLTVDSDIIICVGESTTLTATGNGDFLWSTGETTSSITVQPDSTTTYTVASTLGDCTENESVLVSVSEVPSVDLGADQSICFGESITLTATGTGDFFWSTGETTASITVQPTATTTYSVTASNACLDGQTDEIVVTVGSEITLSAGADVSICTGEMVTLTAVGNSNFLWNTGETTASINVSPMTTASYTVTSTIGNCSISDEVVVDVSELATVDLGPDLTICQGESLTLIAIGDSDFLWSTGQRTPSITINPDQTTTYSVTASNGCATSVTDEITVTVSPNVSLDAISDVSICSGESTTLTAIGNGDFLWSTGETTASITVQPNSSKTYVVTSTLGNCSKSESVSVRVNESPSVNLGPDRSICYGENVTLTAAGNGNFLWSTGETTASITVNPTATTTYSVIASSNSCANNVTDQVVVTVNEQPNVSTGDDITILEGESTVLTATGNGNFLWSTGETTNSLTVSPNATTTYSVAVTSELGCSNQDSIIVTVDGTSDQEVVADAGDDTTICPNTKATLIASGGENYLWSTGETTPSIDVAPKQTTVYTVEVYNGNASSNDKVTVFIDEQCENRTLQQELKIYPNPTQDQLNIELVGYQGPVKVTIYNLNGSLVFKDQMGALKSDYANGILNKRLNLAKYGRGVYFIRFANNGKSQTKKILVI